MLVKSKDMKRLIQARTAEQQLQNQLSATNRSLQEQENATKQLKTFLMRLKRV